MKLSLRHVKIHKLSLILILLANFLPGFHGDQFSLSLSPSFLHHYCTTMTLPSIEQYKSIKSNTSSPQQIEIMTDNKEKEPLPVFLVAVNPPLYLLQ